MGVLGGYGGLLTGDLQDRVLLVVMDYFGWYLGRYSETFEFISVIEVCQEQVSLRGIFGGCGGDLTGDFINVMEDLV